MSIVMFSPYGLASEETGVLALLTGYLSQSGYAVSSLQCNGAFSLCDRDAEGGWRRGVRSCFTCMYEQSRVARWSGISAHELSRFLEPEEISETRRWSLALTPRTAEQLPFADVAFLPMVRESMVSRLGKESIEELSPDEFDVLRRLMLSAARAYIAAQRFLAAQGSQLAMVAGCRDGLSRAFVAAAESQRVAVAQFKWDLMSRAVQVTHPASDRAFSCPIVFDDVTEMRSDPRTWPGEIVRVIDELMVFLDISNSQLQLPLAQ